MSSTRATVKRPVRCADCRSIFTAEIDDDGSIRLIGVGSACGCGGETFTPITAPSPSP